MDIDLTPHEAAPPTAGNGLRPNLADEGLFEYAELLFFAYRDFTGDPDALLAEDGFGRAHHRVLHFVNRYPGMRVASLLDILNITKQSLGRVLKQLIDRGYVEQQAGDNDRRERRLFVTEQGRALAGRLAAPQLERLARALPATEDGMAAVRSFLSAMTGATGNEPAINPSNGAAGGPETR